jgi:hypothetical protein
MDWLGLTGSIGLEASNDANNAYIPLAFTGNPIVFGGGNVGIGTPAPGTNLDVESAAPYPGIAVGNGKTIDAEMFGTCGNYACGNLSLYNAGTGMVRFSADPGIPNYINNGQNVGIGTTNPQHLLHVAGTIGAEEVIVSSTGADYVFEPVYRLAPLSEVDRYINENGHLPDIPSADEMRQKGLGVGDMQAKLLAKIEELTLHMIQAEKENRELRERIVRLEAQTNQREIR